MKADKEWVNVYFHMCSIFAQSTDDPWLNYVQYVQVKLNPEKQLKIESEFFLQGNNISSTQMVSSETANVPITDKCSLTP